MEESANLKGIGTWRRYKLGQAQFTSWLKQTAEKVVTTGGNTPRDGGDDAAKGVNGVGDKAGGGNGDGDVNGNGHGDGDAASQPSSRQKKKKKTANKPASVHTIDPGSDAKFVHWSELEVLAQRVADNADPGDVPESALNILRDVVTLRRKSFTFFSRSTKDEKDEKVKQSNANHAHILGVLERVLAKLEALRPARRGRAARAAARNNEPNDSSHITTADLTNMFSHLEVQTAPDTAEDAVGDDALDGAESAQTPQKGGKNKPGKKTLKKQKPKKAERQAPEASRRGVQSWVDSFRFGLPGEVEDAEEEDEFDLYMMVYCFFEDFNLIRNYVVERWCDYWYHRSVPLDTLAVMTNAAFELFHSLEAELIIELLPLDPSLTQYDSMVDMLFYRYGIDHIDYDSYDVLDQDEEHHRIWRDEADWLALFSSFTLQAVLRTIPPGKVPMMDPTEPDSTVYGATTVKEWKSFEESVTSQIIIESAHLKALKVNQSEPPVLPTESQLLLDLQECLRLKKYSSSVVFSLHLWVDIRNILEHDHDKPFEQLQITAPRLLHALESHNPTRYCQDRDFKRHWIARTRETKHYMVEDFLFEDKQARLRQARRPVDPELFYLLKREPVWAGLLDFRARLVHSQYGHQFVMLSSVVDAAAYLYHAALTAEPALPRWEEMTKYVATYLDDAPFRLGLRAGEGAAIIRSFAKLASGRPERAVSAALLDVDKTFVPAVADRQKLYEHYGYDNPEHGGFFAYVGELAARGRRPALSQASPIDILRTVDDAVTSQVEGLLTLDYFRLFDESAALLGAVADAFGPDMRDRLGPGDGETPVHLGRLPVLLGQDLEGHSDPASVVGKVVEGCMAFTSRAAQATVA